MKKLIFIASAIFFISGTINSQTNPTSSPTPMPTATPQKVKKPIFRANKEQIMQAQKMLKDKTLYAGEADGKMNDPFRASVKTYQKENGLRQSGTLNRATVEKLGIVLTDKQKEIPVNPNDLVPSDSTKTTSTTKKPPVFRATKEQIMAAQKILKDGGMYSGEQTGQLDDATRAGLKKYQEANGLKVTGTLNQLTLEKMGVPLTDKQKENAAANPK